MAFYRLDNLTEFIVSQIRCKIEENECTFFRTYLTNRVIRENLLNKIARTCVKFRNTFDEQAVDTIKHAIQRKELRCKLLLLRFTFTLFDYRLYH